MRPTFSESIDLAVLTAYFDDSGTHAASKVVLWAGFIAPEEAWLKFDEEWRAILVRENVSAFHMYDCENALGEFDRWNRARSDLVIGDLRQVIIQSGLFGVGTAIPRTVWEEVVTGPRAPLMGPIEDFALSSCMRHAISLSRNFIPDSDLSIVFDDRGIESRSIQRIVEFYQKSTISNPTLASVTFQKCNRFSGLQAADMLAWETYRYTLKWIQAGERQRARPHFQGLLNTKKLLGTFLEKDRLQEMFDSAKPRMD
jgi:hypothetical protein